MFLFLFVTALCIDALAASFAYGAQNTKIPPASALVISLICTGVLVFSSGIGSALSLFIPANICGAISFTILFILGLLKSFDFVLKKYILKNSEGSSELRMKISDINFVLTVYADSLKADSDLSKILSPKEAVFLAIALSFDSLAAGLGIGVTGGSLLTLGIFSLASNILAIFLGYILGKFVSGVSDIDFSWLGGLLLIALAISKL